MKFKKLGYKILTPQRDFSRMLKTIERAARNCYRSEGQICEGSDRRLVKKLLDSGHEAMIEHAPNVSVLFFVPRGLTHEYVRHRLASFAQESTRWCNYSQDKFGNQISVIPYMDGLTPAQVKRRKDTWALLEQVYLAEIAEGIKPQQARDNLLICTESDIVITTNVRHWRLIFSLRDEEHAHPQMQWLMHKLVCDFRRRTPLLFDDVGRPI